MIIKVLLPLYIRINNILNIINKNKEKKFFFFLLKTNKQTNRQTKN